MKISYFFKHLTGSLFFFLIIFISAGKVNYWQGWVYVILGVSMATLNYTVLKPDAGLLEERSRPGKDTESWDKAMLGLSLLCTIAMYIVAGLDSGRYHWSPDFPPVLYIAGIILTATGQLLFIIAQKQNRFFSSTVRIQTERGHTVCDTGLYGIVRHPAYAGSVIQAIGFPLLFGSLLSIIPVAFLILIHIARTHLEDNTLQKGLTGYREYSARTRYKIIPMVW